MSINTKNQSTISFKTEGTSQTYGQLITFPAQNNNVPLNNSINKTSKDILVKIISNDANKISSTTSIKDIDRSKISLAALTPTRQTSINLINNLLNSKDSSKQENTNISNLYKNIENYAVVIGGSKSTTELKPILLESTKVDLFITLKSKESEVVEYNTLKEVSVASKFTYNFYTPEETNVTSQEDQSKDPLLKNDIFNVPRYVKLTWEPKHVTEQLLTEEPIALDKAKSSFKPFGVVGYGSYDFKNSFMNSAKKTNLINSDGQSYELTDIHNLDVAFNSTNNGDMFSNTLNVILNTSKNSSPINTLPVFLQNNSSFVNGLLPTENSLIRATVPNASFAKIYMSSSAPSLDPSSKLALSVLGEAVSDITIDRAEPKGFDSIKELARNRIRWIYFIKRKTK